jgi:hypothetical protein
LVRVGGGFESTVAGFERLAGASEAMVVTIEEIVGACGVVNFRSGASEGRAVSARRSS